MKFLLISHGKMAEGIADTLKLFLGEDHPFHFINAFVEGSDVDEDIDSFMSTVNEQEGLIICSDILGGSVNQRVMKFASRPNTAIFSGMNLPMVLQLSSLADEERVDDSACREMIQGMQSSIVYMNDYVETKNQEEIDE